MSQRSHNPTVKLDPWSAVATQCQRDARAFVDSAIARAHADGHTRNGIAQAAYDALGTLYGALMAKCARLEGEVEGLRKRVDRGGLWRRLLRVLGWMEAP